MCPRAILLFVELILTSALSLDAQETSRATRTSEVAVADTIRRLMGEVDRAASALDVNRFMGYFLRDSSVVYAVSGTTRHGWNEIERSHRQGWARVAQATFRLGDLAITVLAPDAAAVTGVGEAHLTLKDGGTREGAFAVTAIWRLTPNGWRIVQMHESFPMRQPAPAGSRRR